MLKLFFLIWENASLVIVFCPCFYFSLRKKDFYAKNANIFIFWIFYSIERSQYMSSSLPTRQLSWQSTKISPVLLKNFKKNFNTSKIKFSWYSYSLNTTFFHFVVIKSSQPYFLKSSSHWVFLSKIFWEMWTGRQLFVFFFLKFFCVSIIFLMRLLDFF